MKTTGKIRLLTLLLGILTALVIVVTQMFYFGAARVAEQTPVAEQQDATTSGDESFISLPSLYSLPSSIHVVLSHEFSFIEEILLDGNQTESRPAELQLHPGRLFKTLFYFIIAPNAP